MSKPGNALSKLRSKLPSTSALLSLSAIGLVVFMVGLPSLRNFAIKQNEIDALRVVVALGKASFSPASNASTALADLLVQHPDLKHRFGDLEYLDEFGLLRAHGYLFELTDIDGNLSLTAWPWSHQRTGRSAFRYRPDGKILANVNDRGLWSGCRPTSEARALRTWQELR
ncbi:MAG: hypothetical protein ACI8TQ_001645 [Planctomycetota bacterium]|jgi:hypothetical protein